MSLQDGDENGTSLIPENKEHPDIKELDLAGMKVKLAEFLEAGESTLKALERLSSSLPEFDADSLMEPSILLQSHRVVPEENKTNFEELTHYCSLLMSYGECSIYGQTKEDILEHLDDKVTHLYWNAKSVQY